MKGRGVAMVSLLCVCWLLLACPGDLRLQVLYDRGDGLRSGDRVVHQGQTVGEVQSVALGPQGRVAVDLQISKSFREKVTNQSRFLITEDPKQPGDRFVEVIQLAEGGSPLVDGAAVEGSTALSLEFERTRRALQAWSDMLQKELGHWQKELRELPEKEWYRELERQLDYWSRELGRASEETRQYFKSEVAPRLEEMLRELRKRLRELGKEKDGEILQTKFEELKRL
jgi:ABC-type transporter Mla subunit MlaD